MANNKTLVIVPIIVVIFLAIIFLALSLPFLNDLLQQGETERENDTVDSELWQPSTCEELLGKAMDASYDGCEMIGSNQICYGNFDVTANAFT